MVPTGCRENVLKHCHDDALSAHGGFYKTVERIRRQYYWPRMDRDTRIYVARCETCLASKPCNTNQTAPMGKFRSSSRPWEMIHLDFIGPLPRSKNGFCYILVVIDYFSKFVHIHPVRSATSAAIIKFLEDRIFLTFGTPR